MVVDLSDALEPPPPPLTILGTATDGEITAAISIDDTTKELGVFELGDGDFSQSQWGKAYNLSETGLWLEMGMILLEVIVTRTSSHCQARTASTEQGVSIH